MRVFVHVFVQIFVLVLSVSHSGVTLGSLLESVGPIRITRCSWGLLGFLGVPGGVLWRAQQGQQSHNVQNATTSSRATLCPGGRGVLHSKHVVV